MIQIAVNLSIGFMVFGVYLYNGNDRIYYSELTFTPAGRQMTCLSNIVQLEVERKFSLHRINT